METEKIPVLINLLALARYHQMPDYPIQLMVQGQLTFHDPDCFVLNYTECMEDEETGETRNASVSLTVEHGRMTMMRSAEALNTMVFARNQRFEGVYRTPYGEMNMAVDTREFSCKVTPQRGEIHLKYLLHFNGSYASTNELHLEFFSETLTEDELGEKNHENTAQ